MKTIKPLSEIKCGLLVDVLKPADGHDCTMNGISSQYDTFVLIFPGCPEIFEQSKDTPALFAVKRKVCGKEYWTAYPDPVSAMIAMEDQHGYSPYCFGGNYVKTSDSRFPNDYPIPIHDRIEE